MYEIFESNMTSTWRGQPCVNYAAALLAVKEELGLVLSKATLSRMYGMLKSKSRKDRGISSTASAGGGDSARRKRKYTDEQVSTETYTEAYVAATAYLAPLLSCGVANPSISYSSFFSFPPTSPFFSVACRKRGCMRFSRRT
jgi:hypothetical protein